MWTVHRVVVFKGFPTYAARQGTALWYPCPSETDLSTTSVKTQLQCIWSRDLHVLL